MKSLDYAQMMVELQIAINELNTAHKMAIAATKAMADGLDTSLADGLDTSFNKLNIQGHTNIIGGTMGKRLVVSNVEVRNDVYIFTIQNRDSFDTQIVYLNRDPDVLKRGNGFDAYRLYIPSNMLPPGAFIDASWTLVGRGLLRNKTSVLNCLWNIVSKCTKLDEDTEVESFDPNTFRITYQN